MKRSIDELEVEHWSAIGRMDPAQIEAMRRMITAVAMATYTKPLALHRLGNILQAEADGLAWPLADLPVPVTH